jgi:hypothetical protein
VKNSYLSRSTAATEYVTNLDEEKSKHVGLAPTTIFAQFVEALVKGTAINALRPVLGGYHKSPQAAIGWASESEPVRVSH